MARLARTIKDRVEQSGESLWVRGEVTGIKLARSGHLYFSLRDQISSVSCTIWKSVAGRLAQPLTEGMEVIVLGAPDVWEERTSLNFIIRQVIPAAVIGAQAQVVERARRALAADGLLDPARKRPLPEFPRRIAVVTSVAGAVLHDIIAVARNRWPGIEFLVVNSAVQGAAAPVELLAAMSLVKLIPDLDCCIIGRGGGGKEDLAAFNDEGLCRAVAACPVPVISAVGHEVDVTLVDLVADLRAATPSQAAEFALPDRRDVVARLEKLQRRLDQNIIALLSRRSERWQRTGERMANALLGRLRVAERTLERLRGNLAPALDRRVSEPRQQLERYGAVLLPLIRRRLEQNQARLQRGAVQLDALSPLAVLARGYAVAVDPTGRILRRSTEFLPGSRFTLTMTDGRIAARVEEQ